MFSGTRALRGSRAAKGVDNLGFHTYGDDDDDNDEYDDDDDDDDDDVQDVVLLLLPVMLSLLFRLVIFASSS